MMETFWCNEEGLRPSEQRIDSLASSIHKVQYYRQSLRFLVPGTRGSTQPSLLGSNHVPLGGNIASQWRLNKTTTANSDYDVVNDNNQAIADDCRVEKSQPVEEAPSPQPSRFVGPDNVGITEQSIVGDMHERHTSNNILSRLEAGQAGAIAESC
jgi:hypothetical protein